MEYPGTTPSVLYHIHFTNRVTDRVWVTRYVQSIMNYYDYLYNTGIRAHLRTDCRKRDAGPVRSVPPVGNKGQCVPTMCLVRQRKDGLPRTTSRGRSNRIGRPNSLLSVHGSEGSWLSWKVLSIGTNVSLNGNGLWLRTVSLYFIGVVKILILIVRILLSILEENMK